MKIDIITLFPNIFSSTFEESIIKRAISNKLVEVRIHNLRDWAVDERGTVDDTPYGGGGGMVLRPEPFFESVEQIGNRDATTILLTPQGSPYSQQKADELSKLENLILLCGHYEGVDERVRTNLADEEISIGDYVLTGGEIPAMVLVDSIVRLIPGVLENENSTQEESFQPLAPNIHHLILEYPQYTKPREYEGLKVPEVLLSGNHMEIRRWREKQSIKRTKERRPDLVTEPSKHQQGV